MLDALAGLPHATCSDDASRLPELHLMPILTGSTHGYAPSDPEMHGLFLARGPPFESGSTLPSFNSVHLYAMFAELLQIEPADQSGDESVTARTRLDGVQDHPMMRRR